MEPRLEATMTHGHVPLALLQQLFRLLPLSTAELHDVVDRALADNPVLARAPGTACPGCGRHLRGRRCPTCASAPVLVTEREHVRDWRSELAAAVRLEVDADVRDLVEFVMGSLDDRGFLTISPHDADFARPGVKLVLDALTRIGPPGIAATGPIDCVIRQCRSLVERGEAPDVLVAIAEQHLEQVANDELPAIASALGVSDAEVRRVVEILRERTRPFVSLGGAMSTPPAPDVFVSWTADRGDLEVDVPDSRWYGLRLTAVPKNTEARQWSAPHRRHAEDLVRQLDARASLLHRIVTVIVAEQRSFVLNAGGAGAGAHRPLRRADVAATLGVHPSTIGRAVNGKWLRFPDGRVISLAACFGASTKARELLRIAMLHHVGATDVELQRVLASGGVVISRRTVAKYRLELGVRARGTKPGSSKPR